MAHYLFNVVAKGGATGGATREKATIDLRAGMWGIDPSEPRRAALAPGDLVLLYVGAPEWKFIGHAELASAGHDWTPSEARVYPGEALGGVLLAAVEEWDPAVPAASVLSEIDTSGGARADYEMGIVRITPDEYKTTVAVARGGSWKS